ncbi:unnamed protein product [Rhizophagus irregularis]|nr:unnamed protein product [Rhizophagus irregularis]
MKVNKTLNLLFVFTIIGEAIFLVIFPLNFINPTHDETHDEMEMELFQLPLWSTLPFILLTGLTTAYYKTIIRTVIFLIVNLSPNIIIVCNILFGDLSKFKYKMITGVIILGIFQVIYLILCIILFKIKSWKWISDPINQLDDKLKKVHNIHQFENALFLMTVSFLGIWIIIMELIRILSIGNLVYFPITMIVNISTSIVFVAIGKESVSLLILFYIASFLELAIIALRLNMDFYIYFEYHRALAIERIIFGILAAISLIILNINTILCQKNFNKKFYLLLNYEIELPKEFDYNYDPKQDDESESKSESEEESLITKCKNLDYVSHYNIYVFWI